MALQCIRSCLSFTARVCARPKVPLFKLTHQAARLCAVHGHAGVDNLMQGINHFKNAWTAVCEDAVGNLVVSAVSLLSCGTMSTVRGPHDVTCSCPDTLLRAMLSHASANHVVTRQVSPSSAFAHSNTHSKDDNARTDTFKDDNTDQTGQETKAEY